MSLTAYSHSTLQLGDHHLLFLFPPLERVAPYITCYLYLRSHPRAPYITYYFTYSSSWGVITYLSPLGKGGTLYHLSHTSSWKIITYCIFILLESVATYITYYHTCIFSSAGKTITGHYICGYYVWVGCSCIVISFCSCSLYFATYTRHRYNFYNYNKSF